MNEIKIPCIPLKSETPPPIKADVFWRAMYDARAMKPQEIHSHFKKPGSNQPLVTRPLRRKAILPK